jgi:aryl-alcohol dehydrogenase-like predicted oxidoreductase
MTLRPDPYEHLRTPATFRTLERLERAAAERGVSLTALSLAWVLAEPRVAAVVVGPRRPEHLAPALSAVDTPLTPAERRVLVAMVR